MLLATTVLLANAGRLGILAVPVMLGVAVARSGALPDVDSAIGALNVYTLFVGFPALIALGVVEVPTAMAASVGLWVVVPVVDLALVGLGVMVATRLPGRQAGTMALVALFGNTAYLGIPFVISVVGEQARGPASLLVAIQVTLAVALGPVLLARWSGEERQGVDLAALVRQPLLWAPLLGVAVRLLPEGASSGAVDVLRPLAASTAAVAMFLLGLYLYEHRDLVRDPEPGVWAHVGLRMVAGPLVSAGVAVALERVGALDGDVVPVVVMLGGMPAAITTFSLARQAEVAPHRVAAVVVRSSLVSAVVLPILATVATRLG